MSIAAGVMLSWLRALHCTTVVHTCCFMFASVSLVRMSMLRLTRCAAGGGRRLQVPCCSHHRSVHGYTAVQALMGSSVE